jgi:hypothetical protein
VFVYLRLFVGCLTKTAASCKKICCSTWRASSDGAERYHTTLSHCVHIFVLSNLCSFYSSLSHLCLGDRSSSCGASRVKPSFYNISSLSKKKQRKKKKSSQFVWKEYAKQRRSDVPKNPIWKSGKNRKGKDAACALQ